ncbi:MAG: undecaprenyl-phosphate glucose phosphotransferase [Candidatus Marinimicrobia bacterium]|nr:undecaprenyl-phosphate glucose phosphotransferase [Candidatus Neomarinimicrobiota bacterium]
MAEWTGLEVVAFFDDDAFLRDQKIEDIPVVNNLDELPIFVVNNEIDQVWMALPLRADERLKSTIASIHELSSAEVRMVPDIYDFPLHNYSVSEVAGLPVLNLTDSPMFGINRVVKTMVDILLSTLALIVLSPLLLLIAVGVKLSSLGPVLYRQERVSWNGKRFNMLKFRSMPVAAEDQTGPQWTKATDHRATWFGSLLRRTSLDELPQFFNVLKGDMSIVGPRPERPVFVEQFRSEVPDYMQKHLVKAGITGWAQVNGWRGDTDLKTRIEYDLYYIENWAVWFDLKIMFLTLFKGFISKNAY